MDYSLIIDNAVVWAKTPFNLLWPGCGVLLLLLFYLVWQRRGHCCGERDCDVDEEAKVSDINLDTEINLTVELLSVFQVISSIVDHDAIQLKSVEDVVKLLAREVLVKINPIGVLGICIKIGEYEFQAGERFAGGWELERDITSEIGHHGTLCLYGAVSEVEYPCDSQKLCLKIADYLASRLTSFLFLKRAMKEVALFRHLIDQATEIILIINPLSGKIIDVNARACIELNYDPHELTGKRLGMILDSGKSDFFSENDTEKYGHEMFMETNLIRKDQTTFPVEMSLKNIDLSSEKYQLAMARDLSARNEMVNQKMDMERQLIQSEKMASVGQLSAGIAHEINNPISFITSNLSAMEDYVHDISTLLTHYRKFVRDVDVEDSDLREKHHELTLLEYELQGAYLLKDLKDIVVESLEGAGRIKQIVQDMKSFAHPGEDKLKEMNVNEGLDSTLNIAWNELKYKVKVHKKYGDIPLVLCFPQQINQVFMNILVNAGQAIEKEGVMTIHTWRQRDMVIVTIQDNGCGMEKKQAERVFEPFFTTKEVGKGTGLGLNVAYNIIRKHGGAIDVESAVGEGTTFTISLPIHGPGGQRRGV